MEAALSASFLTTHITWIHKNTRTQEHKKQQQQQQHKSHSFDHSFLPPFLPSIFPSSHPLSPSRSTGLAYPPAYTCTGRDPSSSLFSLPLAPFLQEHIMPAATLNRDRTAGQQHPGARSQLYQDQTEDARQLHDLAQQYNQDLLNGTPHSTPSIETLVMSMALEQDVDLSSFSMASQGDPQSSLAPNASCDPPSSQAGQQGYADINQTQLLSGSRS